MHIFDILIHISCTVFWHSDTTFWLALWVSGRDTVLRSVVLLKEHNNPIDWPIWALRAFRISNFRRTTKLRFLYCTNCLDSKLHIMCQLRSIYIFEVHSIYPPICLKLKCLHLQWDASRLTSTVILPCLIHTAWFVVLFHLHSSAFFDGYGSHHFPGVILRVSRSTLW